MKLDRISISGFRSFASPVDFDLSADVILLSGPNGTGKTSVVDAILWALVGRIARFGNDQTPVISTYSPDGLARVRLTIADSDNQRIQIDRSFDGERATLKVTSGEQEWVKKDAETFLNEVLWSHLDLASTKPSEIEAVFTKSTYLQQDVVTQFVEDDDVERFKAISALVGSRQIADLQTSLESARNAWKRAQTTRSKEVSEAEAEFRRFGELLERLPELDPSSSLSSSRWTKWLDQLRSLGIPLQSGIPENITSSSSRSIAEVLVKELRSVRRDLDRRIELTNEALDMLGEDIEFPDALTQELDLDFLEKELASKIELLGSLRERAKEEDKRIRNLRDSRAQLAEMARIALIHIGDNCPVCTQSIDEKEVRSRLESLLATQDEPPVQADLSELRRIESEISELQQQKSDQTRHVESIRQIELAAARKLGRAVELAREAGLKPKSPESFQLLSESLRSGSQSLKRKRDGAAELLEDGESLLLDITRYSEFAQRDELEKSYANAEIRLGRLMQTQRNYELTYNSATRVIEGLREAATSITQNQIRAIEPRLKKIYWRIDPHPAFTSVRVKVFMKNGKGHAKVLVNDENFDEVTDQEPKYIFSSSQLNALAVSAFLSFNLQGNNMPIGAAILDDPLQSLDDVNMLGLIDVLRRIKSHRQLILTTHDQRFLKVLSRKLRPADESESLVSIAFSDWNRTGPSFDVHRSTGRTASRSVVGSSD